MKNLVASLLTGLYVVAVIVGFYAAGVVNLLEVPAASGWGAIAYAALGTGAIVLASAFAISVGHDLRAYGRTREESDS